MGQAREDRRGPTVISRTRDECPARRLAGFARRDRGSSSGINWRTGMTWFWRRGGQDRPLIAAASRMVGDAEAFLAGGYEEYLRRHGEYVPTWARLNAFAHGDLESLQRLRRFSDFTDLGWRL